MRRKNRKDEHENAERWLLTYADMITLLMAFFIMMYSMSVLNMSKFKEAAISIRSGFGGIVKGQGRSTLGTTGQFASKPSPISGETAGVSWQVVKPLINYIDKLSKDSKVEIGEDNRGMVITIRSDQMMFKSGSSEISSKANNLLDKIAEMLGQINNLVQIEGHTCNLPPRNPAFFSNWELSTERATNVLRYLVEKKKLSAERFSAAGYAGVRPLYKNDTEANRRKNRRVEIVVLRPEAVPGQQPSQEPRRISDPTEAVFQRSMGNP